MKNRRIAALALATLGGLTCAGLAIAQPSGGERKPAPAVHGRLAAMMFDKADANKDGVLAREEAKAAVERHFDEMDANRDGKLSAAEHDAARKALRDKIKAALFDRIDTSKDGRITRDEFMAAGPDGGHDPVGAADAPYPPLGMMGHGHRRMGMGMGMGKDALTSHGDIAKDVFVTRHMAMFDRVDADHDGKITVAEREAVAARLRDRWQARHGRPAH